MKRKVSKLKEIREARMLTKAELARKAEVTYQTIDRIERGCSCRLETRRKIMLALGLNLEDWRKVFNDRN